MKSRMSLAGRSIAALASLAVIALVAPGAAIAVTAPTAPPLTSNNGVPPKTVGVLIQDTGLGVAGVVRAYVTPEPGATPNAYSVYMVLGAGNRLNRVAVTVPALTATFPAGTKVTRLVSIGPGGPNGAPLTADLALPGQDNTVVFPAHKDIPGQLPLNWMAQLEVTTPTVGQRLTTTLTGLGVPIAPVTATTVANDWTATPCSPPTEGPAMCVTAGGKLAEAGEATTRVMATVQFTPQGATNQKTGGARAAEWGDGSVLVADPSWRRSGSPKPPTAKAYLKTWMSAQKNLRQGTYQVTTTQWGRMYGATGRLVDWYGTTDPTGVALAPPGVVYGQSAELLQNFDQATVVVGGVKPAPKPVPVPVSEPPIAG